MKLSGGEGTSKFAQTLCKFALAGIVTAGLAACGGGGGGSKGDPNGNQPQQFTVTAQAGAGGGISPASRTVESGATASFTITPDAGFEISEVSGCGGNLGGSNYTTGPITANCTVHTSFAEQASQISYEFTSAEVAPGGDLANPKTLRFTWSTKSAPDSFRLEVNPDGASGFVPVLADVPGGSTYVELELDSLHLTQWISASYQLVAVKDGEDVASSDVLPISHVDSARLVGYIKAPVIHEGDWFGSRLALSADGGVLAVAAPNTSFMGQSGNSIAGAGTVYLYEKRGEGWALAEQLWALSPMYEARFGSGVAISADGTRMAVGAPREDYLEEQNAGAVYFYVRTEDGWQQDGKFVTEHPVAYSQLGTTVSLSANGMILAAGAPTPLLPEGEPGDGYAILLDRSSRAETKITAGDSETGDLFGRSLAVSADGKTLVVGAPIKTGDDGSLGVGAVYVFSNDGAENSWNQVQKYSGVEPWGIYGNPIALSADGRALAIGAVRAADEFGDHSSGVFIFKNANSNVADWEWWDPEAYKFIRACSH